MSRLRGSGALAACVLAGAWLLGSTALALMGVGLALAAVAVAGWRRLVVAGLSVERATVDGAPVEGEPLVLEADVRGRRRLSGSLVWEESLDGLGRRTAQVSPDGRARLVFDAVPRGRYHLDQGRLVASDPLGLGHAEVDVERASYVTVRPRVPVLHTLFTDTGTWGDGGRRALVRRASGLEPHGVREYLEGEPLRAVHWPTSARRGELMVRELEDAPRESVAVVLDPDAGSAAGAPGDSSLDDAVRATAGILRAHALRSRQVLLVIAAAEPVLQRVRGLGQDWELALDELAAVEPARRTALRDLIAPQSAVGGVPDLVVVTGRPDAVSDALVARAAMGRSSALVAVDAPTYAGRTPSRTSPALLRLARAGVALAVLRRGTPLQEALGSLRTRSAVG
jgi:uncharacterized protein (DUF58 family)